MQKCFFYIFLLGVGLQSFGGDHLSQRLECFLHKSGDCGEKNPRRKNKEGPGPEREKLFEELFFEARLSFFKRLNPEVLKTSGFVLGFDFQDPPWGHWTVEGSLERGKNKGLKKESISLGLIWRQLWPFKKVELEILGGPHYIWESWSLGEKRQRSFLGTFVGLGLRYSLNPFWRVNFGLRGRAPKQFFKREKGGMQDRKLRDLIYKEDKTWAIYISLGLNYLFN